MVIGDRLKQIRESKYLSQGDIGKTTGLFPAYISRVENGHTVPSIETLEKFARALDTPMYQLMYDGPGPPPELPKIPAKHKEHLWGYSRLDASKLTRLRRALGKMNETDRKLLMVTTSLMARRSRSKWIPT